MQRVSGTFDWVNDGFDTPLGTAERGVELLELANCGVP
jgi:hypothetical protein